MNDQQNERVPDERSQTSESSANQDNERPAPCSWTGVLIEFDKSELLNLFWILQYVGTQEPAGSCFECVGEQEPTGSEFKYVLSGDLVVYAAQRLIAKLKYELPDDRENGRARFFEFDAMKFLGLVWAIEYVDRNKVSAMSFEFDDSELHDLVWVLEYLGEGEPTDAEDWNDRPAQRLIAKLKHVLPDYVLAQVELLRNKTQPSPRVISWRPGRVT